MSGVERENKLLIVLGNGFTIDAIKHLGKEEAIDARNLFHFGDAVNHPYDETPGFLSYKYCPALWTLGARPCMSLDLSNALIQEIITCANMYSDFVNDPDYKSKRLVMLEPSNQSIYIKAYAELVAYLKYLFSYYDGLLSDDELDAYVKTNKDWGWVRFFANIDIEKYNEITIITYNYDIWLERILKSIGIDYYICGFQKNNDAKVKIIKPHGSISFINSTDVNNGKSFGRIISNTVFEPVDISQLSIKYNDLHKYPKSTIIPPAGDSSRIGNGTWASELRNAAKNASKEIGKDDKVIICGLSYWHVDRKELDELLINFDLNANIIYINPAPPRDLNAVLVSLFENYISISSSDYISDFV